MKRHGAIILVVVLAAFTVWGMFCTVSGQAKPEQKATSKEPAGFTIARVVVGTGVENNEPVGVTESFPVSREKVYCFLQVNDIDKDTEVSLVWFHNQD